jgi:hypothetical protein
VREASDTARRRVLEAPERASYAKRAGGISAARKVGKTIATAITSIENADGRRERSVIA